MGLSSTCDFEEMKRKVGLARAASFCVVMQWLSSFWLLFFLKGGVMAPRKDHAAWCKSPLALSSSCAELLAKLGAPLILRLLETMFMFTYGLRFHVVDYITQQSPERARVLFSALRRVDTYAIRTLTTSTTSQELVPVAMRSVWGPVSASFLT